MERVDGIPQEIVVCGLPFGKEIERESLRKVKEMGATSVQIYTFWREFEPNLRGQFDWSSYDRQVALIKEAGLKFVPFILMGPKYAAPKWWLESRGHKGLYCLEHKKYSPIESIWNPLFRDEISRVLQAFAEHYLSINVIESVQPGICGDYGEAIMPVVGNWPGDYHTHCGYWCSGEDAKKSFRDWALNKYRTIEELNKAWRSNYGSFSEIETFLPHKTPSRTAYFDMLDWYRGSMSEYSEFWLKECRKYFPELSVYLCTGGMEEPEHASLFSSQAKIAAKYHCGLRLTNEGNKFYENFFWTAYTKSACDFYGAYLGLEPVGPMTRKGVAARTFGSAAYGNRQIFHYYNNLFQKDGIDSTAADIVAKNLPLISERKQSEAVAVFWPNYLGAWYGGMPGNVNAALSFIRKMRNCMPVNEEMVMDGALNNRKLLVIPVSGFTTKEVLKKIAQWVQSGGTVLAAGSMTDLELDSVEEYNEIFGIMPDSEETAGHCTQYTIDDGSFVELSKIKEYHTMSSWMGLSSHAVFLSSTKEGLDSRGVETKKTGSIFYKKTGKGMGIFYNGPVNFVDDPEAIMYDPGVFKALLEDVLKNYSLTVDLTPASNEIARAEINGVIYALKNDEIIKI